MDLVVEEEIEDVEIPVEEKVEGVEIRRGRGRKLIIPR